MLREEVTDQDIAAVVRSLDRNPGRAMMEGEREKLLTWKRAIGARVIGQPMRSKQSLWPSCRAPRRITGS
jgi:ATP-dependent Clp protease ATP-binding subunit ClpA